jgi:2-polyprenyl-3-methyl-5-hydroxy-6-metoxy-1,4-benzoquinol methylase
MKPAQDLSLRNTLVLPGCPVCDARDTVFQAEKTGYRFSRCPHCEFLFANPRPAQEELDRLYSDPQQEAEPTYDKAGSRLRRAYLKLPRFLPYAWRKDTIDLGCGGGFIAHVLSRVARSSTGVDISANAIAYARRRFPRPRFVCASLAHLPDLGRFDFVYSSEVIEHVSDVNAYLRALRNLTRDGGYVYITTPDLGHPKVPSDIERWDVFQPPVHLQFFTRKTAAILFARYGFEIVRYYPNRKPGLIFLARKLSRTTARSSADPESG